MNMYFFLVWTQYIFHIDGGRARVWLLKQTVHHLMRMLCTIPSMEATLSSHSKTPMSHRRLTAPTLECAPVCLATGARRGSIQQLGCGLPLASLHPGGPWQSRLCLPERPIQVGSDDQVLPCVIDIIYETSDLFFFLAGEMEDFLRTQWESTSIRHSFIRKVKVSPLHVPVGLLCEFFLFPLCHLLNRFARSLSRCTSFWQHSLPSPFQWSPSSPSCKCPGETFSCLRTPEWSSPLSARAETQWGCLSSDILASTGRLCKWIKTFRTVICV